jgi:hypothetical protein
MALPVEASGDHRGVGDHPATATIGMVSSLWGAVVPDRMADMGCLIGAGRRGAAVEVIVHGRGDSYRFGHEPRWAIGIGRPGQL